MKLLDVITAPWAITPDKYREICAIYARHLGGEKIDIAGIEAQMGQPFPGGQQRGFDVVNGTAVLPIHGVVAKRMNLFSRVSGGTSTELIGKDFQQALEAPDVERIVLDIDSPGGAVDGTAELAQMIFEARGQKPVTAVASGMMASAAYWIGSAADRVLITGPTTEVGSIGVVATHTDRSKALEKAGLKVTEIAAGRFKRIASQNEPLSQEGREYIQDRVDYLYMVFLEAVAQHRGVASTEQVHEQMADGRLFTGQQAIDAGLVDGVSTMEALLESADGNPSGFFSLNSSGGGESLDAETTEDDMDAKDDTQVPPMTAAILKEQHPDVFKTVKAEGYEEGLKDGAARELERVKAVKAKALPGHEALVEELMFDGKTTGPEAAEKVVSAEGAKREAQLKAIKDEAPDPVENAGDAGQVDVSSLPLEERCKVEWEKSPDLRAEFGGDLDRYVAFTRAEKSGQARVLRK